MSVTDLKVGQFCSFIIQFGNGRLFIFRIFSEIRAKGCFSVSIIFVAHNFPSHVSITAVIFYNQSLAYVKGEKELP